MFATKKVHILQVNGQMLYVPMEVSSKQYVIYFLLKTQNCFEFLFHYCLENDLVEGTLTSIVTFRAPFICDYDILKWPGHPTF